MTAATNIRASNFGIQMESLFKVKEMAGKIVPAISSSNAMAASLQVIEAIKLIEGKQENYRGIVYKRLDKTVKVSSLSRVRE